MPQPAKSAKLQLLQKNPNKKNVNELKKRAEAEERLQMKSDNIRAPGWLNKNAKKAFDFLKEELLEIELITNGDVYPLAMYCYWYSEHLTLQEQATKAQKDDPEGIGNPLIKQLDTCSKNMRSFGSDLGLSPSARAKLAIKMAQSEDDDEWT
ncbi:phage terminase small subunit P27 family [Enterococcus faecium]|uniref:phage terminase small subunit P27 family n=1 Tax=Enterococcus faecium TaxID=1352 RepID=UPI0019FAD146|nr:phage terminase small subunit P27 family [Enterococcus faecium]EGP5054867.1 phage terminase small subunit P27 family [Enterococcus faecium]MDF3825579.1 phage terminase small subunit P27 family [Enterococcus faecium]